jgi:hypothetical protein
MGSGPVTFYWSSTPTPDRGPYYFRVASDGITTLYVEDYNHDYG